MSFDLNPYAAVVINQFENKGFNAIDDAGTFITSFKYIEENMQFWQNKKAYALQVDMAYEDNGALFPIGANLRSSYLLLDMAPDGEFLFRTEGSDGPSPAPNAADATIDGTFYFDSSHQYQSDPEFPNGLLYYTFLWVLKNPKRMPPIETLNVGNLFFQQQVVSSGGFFPYNINFDEVSGITTWAVRMTMYVEGTEPPLRMRQRNDGLSIQGHARLNQRASSGSSSEQTGIRLRRANTYV